MALVFFVLFERLGDEDFRRWYVQPMLPYGKSKLWSKGSDFIEIGEPLKLSPFDHTPNAQLSLP